MEMYRTRRRREGLSDETQKRGKKVRHEGEESRAQGRRE
jgi:hypothetical protein